MVFLVAVFLFLPGIDVSVMMVYARNLWNQISPNDKKVFKIRPLALSLSLVYMKLMPTRP